MNKKVAQFISSKFQPTIGECEKFLFLVRGVELQRDAAQTLEDLKGDILHLKNSMIRKKEEDAANCCLSLEMATLALQHELRLWVALKEDRMNDAWDELVDAESYTDAAIRAHEISNHMMAYFKRLNSIEELLFPGIIFMSPGFTILSSRCTICGSEYGSCDHLKGLPYMGKFCAREITKMRMQEISIVDTPANRHARVTAITIDGAIRDLLTWRVVPDNP